MKILRILVRSNAFILYGHCPLIWIDGPIVVQYEVNAHTLRPETSRIKNTFLSPQEECNKEN